MSTLQKFDHNALLIKPYNDLKERVDKTDVKLAKKGELETVLKDGKKSFKLLNDLLDEKLLEVLKPIHDEIELRNTEFAETKNSNIERVNRIVMQSLENTPIKFDLFIDKSWYNKSFEKDDALDIAIKEKINAIKIEVSLLKQLNATEEQMNIFYDTLMLSKCIVRNKTFFVRASDFQIEMIIDWMEKNGISYTEQ